MLKKFNKHIKNEKGLTLIELLAVIVILAIVAAIAVPAIGNIITNAKVNALKADGNNVLAAAGLYFVENESEDGKVTQKQLLESGFLDDAGGFAIAGSTPAVVEKVNGGNEITGVAVKDKKQVEFITATNTDINAKPLVEAKVKISDVKD